MQTVAEMDPNVPPIYYDDTLAICDHPPGANGVGRTDRAPLRLDLGAGNFCAPGFTAVDRKLGTEVYPLVYPDAAADEIRASHVLEHFGHREVEAVLRDWVRVLKPGGWLKVAVPNFEYIARGYIEGRKEPFGPYLMGGQTDADDFHRTVFDEEHLSTLLAEAGLVNVRPWVSTVEGDCASLPVSLNLEGMKPKPRPARPLPKVAAVMSMPRLAFSDNMFCVVGVAAALGLPFRKVTGAFWGQCLERIMEDAITEDVEYILTADYDSCFTVEQVRWLFELAQDHPEADAIAPIQVKREEDALLMGILQSDGTPYPPGTAIGLDKFAPDLTRAAWAHFGCTLLRVSALKTLPHPWFLSVPNAEGRWHEGRQDDDTYFWRQWREHGRSLYLANRVPIGHAFLMIAWPDAEGGILYQRPTDFALGKLPAGVWR